MSNAARAVRSDDSSDAKLMKYASGMHYIGGQPSVGGGGLESDQRVHHYFRIKLARKG